MGYSRVIRSPKQTDVDPDASRLAQNIGPLHTYILLQVFRTESL